MRKLFILLVLIVLTVIGLNACSSDENTYFWGRDSVVRIGEGRFDILRYPSLDQEGKHYYYYGISDKDVREEIEMDISKHYDHRKSGKVYLIGSMGYTVIDYKNTKTYEQHSTIEEFSIEDQKIFNTKWFREPNAMPLYVYGAGIVFILFILLLIFRRRIVECMKKLFSKCLKAV